MSSQKKKKGGGGFCHLKKKKGLGLGFLCLKISDFYDKFFFRGGGGQCHNKNKYQVYYAKCTVSYDFVCVVGVRLRNYIRDERRME